tara:strand:+ start:164 stop:370 length:207 start_codon:yes stop_codon:yes gene_type:complete
MFKIEPSKKLKSYMDDIQIPAEKLKEIYEIMCNMTQKMKDEIDEYDPWSTKSYLLTSGKFEKVFNHPI